MPASARDRTGFRVLGSTLQWPHGGVTVSGNTGTDPTRTDGVPVYWLGGDRIAANYRDFLDLPAAYGDRRYWESRSPTDEHGRSSASNCRVGGQPHVCVSTGFAPQYPLGGPFASTGVPTLAPGTGPEVALDHGESLTPAADARPLYGLSPVYRVVPAGHVFPVVSIADATASEGSTIEFLISLSAPTTVDVSMLFERTTARTGTGERKFFAWPHSVTIRAGDTRATLRMRLIDNAEFEADRTFTVRITYASNATLGDAEASGTIIEDDRYPLLRDNAARTVEGDRATLAVQFVEPPPRELDLAWATVDGTARAGEDFVARDGGFRLGERPAYISVPTVENDRREPEEQFRIRIRPRPDGVLFSNGEREVYAIATILDDDLPQVEVSLGVSAYRVPEGGSIAVSVSLRGDLDREAIVPIRQELVGGASTADLSGVPESLTFASDGARSQTFSLTAVDDSEDDDAEGVTLRFGALPQGVSVGDTGAVTIYIADDDGVGVALSRSVLPLAEGGMGSYGVVLLAKPSGPLRITVGGVANTDVRVAPAALDFTATNWATAQTVTVRAVEDDGDALVDDPVVLTHTGSGSGYDGVRVPPLTVTIAENDRSTVLSQNVAGFESHPRPFGIPVRLSIPSTAPVFVDYATEDDTARAPGDYRSVRGRLRFDAQRTVNVVRVSVVDDDVDEDQFEGFLVTLSNVVNADFPEGAETLSASVFIQDDDDPRVIVSFATGAYTAAEGGAAAGVTVRLDRDPKRALRIPLAVTRHGGATAADFEIPEAVTFARRQVEASFEVIATDDLDDDDGERVAIAFGALPDRVTAGAPSVANVRIADNDAPGIVVPEPPSVPVVEGGTTSYPVMLATRPSGNVTVATGVRGNAAVSAAPPSLTFTSGNWLDAQLVTLTADEDANLIVEAPATVTHSATGANYGGLSASVTVPVTETDTATVSVADVASDEADGQLAFVVTLDQPSSAEVTVDYATVDLVATSPADFGATRGRLRFAPGGTEATVRVPIVDDDIDEDETETFELRLDNPVNAGFDDGVETLSATGSIRDDDIPLVRVSFDRTVHAASEGGPDAQVRVTIDRDPERTLVVPLTATPEGGAVVGDYRAPASVTFQAGGARIASVAVVAVDDDEDEGEERVALTLTLAERTAAGDHVEATVHLLDNDGRGLVVSDATPEVPEGGSAAFTVALGSRPTASVTVTVSVAAGDLSAAPAALTFTRDAWASPQSVELTAARDTDFLADAPVAVTLTAADGGYDGQSVVVTATIVERDRATLAVADAFAREGDGGVNFSVTLDRPGSGVVTVDYATADGSATAPGDYIATSGVLRLPAGETARTIRVPVRDDVADDVQESATFTLTLRNATNAAFASNAAAVTVTGRIDDDDDPRVLVSFEAPVYTAREHGDAARVVVRIDRDPERTVTVPLIPAYGTGASAADHGSLPGSVTFEAGGPLARTVEVAATDDAIDEGTETVSLGFGDLGSRTAAGRPATATVHLLDDDRRGLVASETSIPVPDGEAVGYTVGLASRPTQQVVVAIILSAEVGISRSPASLTFAPDAWSTAQTVTLTAVHDDDLIDSEQVQITHEASGGDYQSQSHVVTAWIREGPPTVSISATVVASESDPHMDFAVATNGASDLEVTLDYATADGTAVAGVDYTATRGTLTFVARTLNRTIRVPLLAADDEDEEIERKTFELVLRNLANGEFTGGAGSLTAAGQILDDDVPHVVVTLDADAYGVSESDPNTPATIQVRVDRDPERTLPVPLAFNHVGGASEDDYVADSRVVFQAGGSLTARARLFANDDRINDDGESVTIGFGELPDRVSAGTSARATVRITDDDTPELRASLSALLVREGRGGRRYWLSLATQPDSDVTVETRLEPEETDLYVGPSSIVFTAADWSSKPVTVWAHSDSDAEEDALTIIRHVASGGDYDGLEVTITARVLEKDRPVFEVGEFSTDEGAGTLDFAVTLDRAPERQVTVEYETVDGTALAPDDYAAAGGVLTFQVGERAHTVIVPLVDDDFDEEEEESFGLVLRNPVNADHALGEWSRTATGIIVDNDDPRVKVTYGPQPYDLLEGDPVTIHELVGNVGQPTSRNLASAGGQGVVGTVAQRFVTGPHPLGYLLDSMTLYITSSLAGLRVTVVRGALDGEDAIDLVAPPDVGTNEDTEPDVFMVPPNTVLEPGTAYWVVIRGNIAVDVAETTDTDAGTAPGWSLAPLPFSSGGLAGVVGPLRISVVGRRIFAGVVAVSIDRDPERELDIRLTESPFGGASDADYTDVPQALTFEAGGPLRQRFLLWAPDDDFAEDDEGVDLGFESLPDRVTEDAESSGRVDIIDDDVRGLVFTPSALRMAEGTTATYEVALTSEPLGPVNVAVSIPDGAALTAQPTALTFAPAAWRETQTVTVTAALDEDALVPAPAILAHATTGADYARFPGAGFAVEVSETTLPLLFFDPTELSVLESAGTVTLTVRMGQPSSRDVEVEVATADGTAYGSRPDYTGDFGTLRRRVTFAAGELIQTFEVTVHNDDRYEEEETFLVQLRAAANGEVGGAAVATVTIRNDDDPPIHVAFGQVVQGPLPEEEAPPLPDGLVLVGNLVAGDDSIYWQIGGDEMIEDESDRVGSRDFRAALQRVTTGAGFAAFRLGGIRLYFTAFEEGTVPRITIAEWIPDAPLSAQIARWQQCDEPETQFDCIRLQNPDTYVVPGEVAFRAPRDTVLKPDTTYAVVLETEDVQQEFVVTGTALANLDGAWPGWSLEKAYVRTGNNQASWRDSAGSTGFRIGVHGDVLTPSTAVLLSVSPRRAQEDQGPAIVTVTGRLNAAARDVETSVAVSLGGGGDSASTADYDQTAGATLTIPAGQQFGVADLTLTPVDDEEKEYTETVSVIGATTDLAVVPTVFRIGDDDRIEIIAVDLLEAQWVDVEVTVSADAERTIEVPVESTTRGGASAADYTPTATVFTFEAGQPLTQTFRVTIADDAVDDDGEGVSYNIGTLTAERVAAVQPGEVRIEILDDDTRGVAVVPSVVEIEEGGTGSYQVGLSSAPTGNVEVRVTGMDPDNTNLTAPAAALTLTFTPSNWSTAQSVSLMTVADDDEVQEPPIVLSHTVVGADYAGLLARQVTVRIIELGATQPVLVEVGVYFGLAAYSATEGGPAATVAVHIDADPDREVEVPIRASPGNGALAADFSGVPASVTFTDDGPRRLTFDVTATDDAVDDDGETVTLGLGALPAAVTAVGLDGAVIDLLDNDTVGLVVSASGLDVPEGGSDTYTVALATEPSANVTVTVAGTGAEITALPASLTFTAANWAMPQTVRLSAIHDADAVADDPVEVTHQAAGGDYAALVGPTLTATIVEDDVAVLGVAAANAPEAGGKLAFVVMLDRPTSNVVTAAYATADGVATAPADYAWSAGRLRLEAGETRFTIEVPIVDDDFDEDENETFSLVMDSLSNAVFAGGTTLTATGTIVDDDDPSVLVAYAGPSYTAAEGGDALVEVVLDRDPEREVAIPIVHTPSNGAVPADYSGVPGSVTFTAGAVSRTFTLAATDDDIADPGETAALSFGASMPARVDAGGQATTTVSILDDDRRGVVVSVTDLDVDEGTTGDYTVALTSEPTADVEVTVAGATTALTVMPATLTFSSTDWRTAQTVQVTAAQDDDAVDEAPVTLTHSATGGGYGSLSIDAVRVVAVDDDRPELSLTQSLAVDEGAGSADFVVRLDKPSSRPLTVDYATVNGTAEEPGDYAYTAGTLTFAAGRTALTIAIGIVDDDADEAEEETFTLTLTNAQGVDFAGGATSLTRTVTIGDDDIPNVAVGFLGVDYTATEGAAAATVEVRLDSDPERELVLALSHEPAGGASAADYSGVPAALTFGVGVTSRAFTVTATDDAFDDDGESAVLRMGPPGDSAVEGVDYAAVADFTVTIPANQASGTGRFTLRPRDDADVEGRESLSMTGVAGGGLTVDGTPLALADDDAPSTAVLLSVSPAFVGEDAGATTVTLAAVLDGESRAQSTVVTVSVGRAGDSAQEGTDYAVVTDFSLTIPSNFTRATQTFTFAPTADQSDEGGESATVSGSTAGLRVIGTALWIADAERASSRIALTLSPAAVAEDAGPSAVAVTATLDGRVRTTPTPVTVRVGWLPDRVRMGTPQATVHLADDDTRGVSVSATAVAVPEGGSAGYEVALRSAPSAAAVLSLTVPAGDLSASPVAMTFSADNWADAQTVTLTAAVDQDAAADDPVTIAHRVAGGDYADVPVADVVATIAEKDTPVLTVSGAEVVAEQGGAARFEFALDRASGASVTASYTTADGTATAPDDYAALRGTLVFLAGETSQTISVPVFDDAVDEAEAETFALVLSNPEGIDFADGASTVTVTRTIQDDDDPTFEVSFEQAVYAVAEGAALTVTVRASADPERRVVVPLTHVPEDGAVAGDYSGVPAALTFEAGTRQRSFTLQAREDAVDDDDETVALGFVRLPSGVSAGPPDAATVYLADNDARGVAVSDEELLVTEGGSDTYEVVLASEPTADVTISVGVPGNAGLQVSASVLTFTPGNWRRAQTVRVTADQDEDARGNAPAELTHTAVGGDYGGESVAGVRVTVLEDDVPGISLTPTVSVAEGDGRATFTVTVDTDTDREIAVDYATADVSATAPGDYTATGGTLTIAGGVAAGTIEVPIIDDDDDEAESETFTLALTAVRNAAFAGGATKLTGTATIADDDDPRVTVAFGSTLYVAAEGGPAVAVAVALDAEPDRDVVIRLTHAGADGAAAADYTGVPDALTFTAGGALRQTFDVTATDDDVDDDGEAVTLGFGALPARVATGATASARVLLDDDDARGVTVSVADLSVVEGGSGSYTVVLTSEPTADVVIAVGGATAELAATASLTFTTGTWQSARTVTVTASEDNDALADAAVALTHTATGGGYAGLTIASVGVNVLENDRPVVSLGGDLRLAESTVTASFPVRLDQASSAVVTVDYATANGTAEAPDDFTATSGTLTFATGATAATIDVTLVDDAIDEEEAETFAFVLGNPSNAALLGDASELRVTATITDDDDPAVEVAFAAEVYSATEGEEVAVVVALDAVPERELALRLTHVPGDGAQTADYSGVPASLVFAADARTGTFTVTATDDAVDDDGETVGLGFGELPAGVSVGDPMTATLHLGDDDARGVTVSQAELSIAEGTSATYTVGLVSEPTANVEVAVTVPQDAAFTASPLSLTFATSGWRTARTVMVTANSDDDAVVPPPATLTHTVSGGDYEGESAASVRVRIADDSVPEVSLSPATLDATEAVGSLTWTATLDVASSRTVTVDYASADGTAVAGEDYTAATGTLTFAPSALTATFSVTVLDDARDEEDQQFTVDAAHTDGSGPRRHGGVDGHLAGRRCGAVGRPSDGAADRWRECWRGGGDGLPVAGQRPGRDRGLRDLRRAGGGRGHGCGEAVRRLHR